MAEPFIPDRGDQQGTIPAADAGAGAPPPAEGFGVQGEEPDAAAGGGGGGGDLAEELARREPQDPPFRTPEPGRG